MRRPDLPVLITCRDFLYLQMEEGSVLFIDYRLPPCGYQPTCVLFRDLPQTELLLRTIVGCQLYVIAIIKLVRMRLHKH